jgi:hypothetical protein
MKTNVLTILSALLMVLAVLVANRTLADEDLVGEFEEVSVVFEQNATDEDVEVVFKANGGDEGLRRLSVTGPNGEKVVELSCPTAGAMGLRQFVFESPEPRDDGALRVAFPEGTYEFSGESVSGEKFASKADLTHSLPDVVTLLHPEKDAEEVAVEGLQIKWTSVSGVTTYLVEIEQEETGVTLNVSLSGSVDSFAVPSGFLTPGTEYTLAIGTQTAGGNSSFIETNFETAK